LVVVNGSAEVVMNMGVDDQRGKTRRLLILENRGAELRLGYGEVKKM
jgi:hypothetical protein